MRGADALILLASGAVALLVMSLAVWMAARSRVSKRRKPPRRTFEHGRRLGQMRRVLSTDEAIVALGSTPVGDLADARPRETGVDVALMRRRGQPCAQAAGYLAGLFESAWAHEVVVMHPTCAGELGGTCQYVVRRAVTTSARSEGASTQGSGDEPRRSTRARAGG